MFLSRRVVFSKRAGVIVGAAVVMAGGAVAGVAAASNGGSGGAGSPGGSGSVNTAPVVRTNLTTTTQVGGAIGYGGSYTVAAPSGASASQISQQEQLVAEDQQQLSADEQAVSDTSATGGQSVSAAQENVDAAKSTLTADQAIEKKDCAGGSADAFTAVPAAAPSPGTGPAPGAGEPSPGTGSSPGPGGSSSPGTGGQSACSQDEQKVSADQTALTQAEQQLAAARTSGKAGNDQAQAKAGADKVKLQGDTATLAQLRATATNPGTAYTWLPKEGQDIKEDQSVYAVSGEPVPLLYGAVPAYRAFYKGMSGGGDVGALTHDLIALGYGDGLTQSNHYSAATAAAVERWQKARGLPTTGEILLGEVVFEPGPIRVTSVTPSVGESTGSGGGGGTGNAGGGGTILTATGTAPVVSVDLDVTQEYLVKPGDKVSVVLPDGTSTVRGRVESIGNVATCPGGSGTGSGSGGSGGGTADQPPCSSSGSSGTDSSPTVTVTIILNGTPKGAALDQAPVNVNITTQTAGNVLAVPVNALLALSEGGYGVDVVTGGTSHLVAVTTGLYSNSMVQVSGSGIAPGERVEVPAS